MERWKGRTLGRAGEKGEGGGRWRKFGREGVDGVGGSKRAAFRTGLIDLGWTRLAGLSWAWLWLCFRCASTHAGSGHLRLVSPSLPPSPPPPLLLYSFHFLFLLPFSLLFSLIRPILAPTYLYLSIHPSTYLSIHPSIHLSIYLSIYLPIYLYIICTPLLPFHPLSLSLCPLPGGHWASILRAEIGQVLLTLSDPSKMCMCRASCAR